MKKYLILLLLPILAFASIGKITALKGDVKVKRDSATIQAKAGTKLEKNDFISTDKNAKVQIVFTDKTVFTMGKNSTLDIADYLYDEAQPKKNTAKFNVLKGAFSSITGRIGKLNKSKFKLKTKSASIGIRGTIVKANQYEVMCTEGAITVETPNGATVRVEAGEKTVVSSGIPTAPVAVTQTEVDAMNEETGADVATQAAQTATTQEGRQKVISEADSINEDTKASDMQSSVTEQEESQKRDTILHGRTIDAQGNKQTMEIEASNLGDKLILGDSGLELTDDSGNVVESTSDETITWGRWEDDPSKKWVAGQQTEATVMQNMQNDSENTVNASYQGKVMGGVNGEDEIKMDSSNQVNINFELGSGKNTMDGDMKFKTESEQSWNSTFSGSASGNSFISTSESGTMTQDDVTTNIDSSSEIKGEFYGENADAVGGSFKLDAGSDSATGVFKADKQ